MEVHPPTDVLYCCVLCAVCIAVCAMKSHCRTPTESMTPLRAAGRMHSVGTGDANDVAGDTRADAGDTRRTPSVASTPPDTTNLCGVRGVARGGV